MRSSSKFLKIVFVFIIFLFSCSKTSESSFFNSKSETNTKSLGDEITNFVKANYECFEIIESSEFFNDKTTTTQYFIDSILPRYVGHFITINSTDTRVQ